MKNYFHGYFEGIKKKIDNKLQEPASKKLKGDDTFKFQQHRDKIQFGFNLKILQIIQNLHQL